MKKFIVLLTSFLYFADCGAQGMQLSLDSCISMALRENKQIQIAKLKHDVAVNTRKAARTAYMPRITGLAGYMHTGDELSLLTSDQQTALSGLGTTTISQLTPVLGQQMQQFFGGMAQIFPDRAAALGQMGQQMQQAVGQMSQGYADALNKTGEKIVDAFRTDTRDIFTASVMLRQPVFMGGAIVAANKMAALAEDISDIRTNMSEELVVYNVQKAYYLVVEVEHKKQLADEYTSLIKKLNSDVDLMIQEGVATRADGLKVSVKLNEAEMQQLMAEDGLILAKMMLCKLCGLPLDSEITVDTEVVMPEAELGSVNNRGELKLLDKSLSILDQKNKMTRAAIMPQVLLTGGYLASSPSVFNGFENKFKGTWNVGVMLRVPLLDCFETGYKMRAGKAQLNIARLELNEAQELIDMQIKQSQFKLGEATKKHSVATHNLETAEENMRCANEGFAEGVMTTTDVMMAQTAWLQAKTQKIESELGVITAKLALNHAYGN